MSALTDLQSLGGLDFLLAIGRGELPVPPIHELLGVEGVEVERGRVVFALAPAERHTNPMGTVHGGVLATILDSAMACAVHSTLGAGASYTTTDLHVTFVRAATVRSGRLLAEGKLVHAGGRLATAEGRITDAQGRLVAHGVESCMILTPRAGAAA
jgi:uncharacterized protein (TIGR00369 family)